MKFVKSFFNRLITVRSLFSELSSDVFYFYQFLYALLNADIYRNFVQPPFTFTYVGFEFLQPLPGAGMYFYVGLMVLLAFMVIIGAWYCLAMAFFALLWTALYLMQKADYNNHYYL
jgi:hypothetical protein